MFPYLSKKKHFRYRPPKHPQHDLALIKVDKPIKFSTKIMPICLPPSEKFPDEKGIVYVAGWGLHHKSTKDDCTTNEKGPDPFSKCKFPFFIDNLSIGFTQCMKLKSPSARNQGCKSLYKLMKKKNATASFLDRYRVNTDIFIAHLRAIAINHRVTKSFSQICGSKCDS